MLVVPGFTFLRALATHPAATPQVWQSAPGPIDRWVPAAL